MILIAQNSMTPNQQGIQSMKEKIALILKMIRCEKHDVPFIEKYRFDELVPELEKENVWKIFSLDIEYGKFMVQKNKLLSFF